MAETLIGQAGRLPVADKAWEGLADTAAGNEFVAHLHKMARANAYRGW